MKFGINTFLWSAHFGPASFGLLPQTKANSFDRIEATLIRPVDFAVADIRRALDDNQLECTLCSVLPPEPSLIIEDASTRKKTVAHLSECIRQTAEAGAKILAGPLYCPVGLLPGRRRTTQEWNWAVEGYQQLAPVLHKYSVDLCIEPLNRFETFFLNTTADAVALCEAVGDPAIGILWDTFHANIEEKNLPAALRLGSAHISACTRAKTIVASPVLGTWTGRVCFRRWPVSATTDGSRLRASGSIGDLAAAASIWRDLAADPDQIAWQGGPFLRSQLEATRGLA